MGSHDPFGHFKHNLWPKERTGVKLLIWPPTTKSWESTRFPCVQVARNILFEIFWQELQLCFKLHFNRRSSHKVMGPQSCKSSNFGNFKIPIWESRTKCHLDVSFMNRHIVYYKGEGCGFPQVWAMVSLVNLSCPWLVVLTPKLLQLCINHLVFILCKSVWVVDVFHSS
jgi:hypothetical protein